MKMTCPRCWGSGREPAESLPARMLAARLRESCRRCGAAGYAADEQLTPHFRLGELLRSEAAARHGYPNEPPEGELDAPVGARLRETAQVLEAVREAIAAPLRVTSGYRSRRVNLLVGGSERSAHVAGWAADVVPVGVTIGEAMRRVVAAGVPLDQLIYEGTWIHVGVRQPVTGARRGEVFALLPGPGGKRERTAFRPEDPRVQVLG